MFAPPASPFLRVVSVTASPVAVKPGEFIGVTVVVHNDGGAAATGVGMNAPGLSGGGAATLAGGPTPATVASLAGGASATFTFTYLAAGEGYVVFAAIARAGNAADSAPVSSATVTIAAPGKQPSDVVADPNPYSPSSGVTLRFWNIPAYSTIRVFTIAGEQVRRTEADVFGVATWNGKNDRGTRVMPGVYLFAVESPAGKRYTGKLQVDR